MNVVVFEEFVIDEFDQLFDEMVEGLDNVVFVVEDCFEDGIFDLLGLYDGLVFIECIQYGMGELFDWIVVYWELYFVQCEDEVDFWDEIYMIFVYEIVYFYGLDDW